MTNKKRRLTWMNEISSRMCADCGDRPAFTILWNDNKITYICELCVEPLRENPWDIRLITKLEGR